MTDTDHGNTMPLTFDDLKLIEPIARAVREKGYEKPSPIQEQSIPLVLEGRDLMALAQTGTGKTAAFTLPLLQRLLDKPKASGNRVKALVLTPTRELAAQILENARAYGEHTRIRSEVVFGGVKINPQMQKLRSGVELLVATPGRLLDLQSQNALKFDELEILVLDEADRMLDMGFIHDIRRILKLLPQKRQNLLFSATLSEEIRTLARGLLDNPAEVSVARENSTNASVSHKLHPVDKGAKVRLLSHLARTQKWQQALVFSRTKHGANKLVRLLENDGIRAAAIHGNKSQNQRTKALADFKEGKIELLIATDIAARGIDIQQLPLVVNYDLPNVPADYVHRIGRTGRAGSEGHAISLVTEDEFDQLQDIERLIQQHIEREVLDGFVPQNPLSESRPLLPPKHKKPKKPKAPRPEQNSQNRDRQSAPQRTSQTTDNNRSQKPRRRKPQSGAAQGGAAKARSAQSPSSQSPAHSSGRTDSGTRPPSSRRRSQRPKQKSV